MNYTKSEDERDMAKELRNGYTTGTCAAAAATAAAWYAFAGQEKRRVWVELPGGGMVNMAVEKEFSQEEWDREPWFFAEKDAGDDPDVTDRVKVYGSIEPLKDFRGGRENGNLWYHSEEYPCLFLPRDTPVPAW